MYWQYNQNEHGFLSGVNMFKNMCKLLASVLILLLCVAFALVACDDGKTEDVSDLQFGLGNDGTFYMVSGINNEERTMLEIPSKYKGLPVKCIDNSAFKGCRHLERIIIPNSVTRIDDSAFAFCANLTSIILPESINYIGCNAFEGCNSLTNIVIPTSVEYVGKEAFKDCDSLTMVDWNPKACETAGSGTYQYTVFRGCTSLKTVNIGSEVTVIPAYTFYGCSNLITVDFSKNNQLKLIGEQAFYDCNHLTNLALPRSKNDIRIEQHAFVHCYNLKTVTIPLSVTSISSYAFRDCGNLIFYCEAESQPRDWMAEWNYDKCPVRWGSVV